MAVHETANVRLFSRVAKQRLEDAIVLLRNKRTTGAMYLAGYAVECMLKALLLSSLPGSRHATMIKGFRGRLGHNLDWLKSELNKTGVALPREMARDFVRINTEFVVWRYFSGARKFHEARDFVSAVERLVRWIDGRI